MTGRPRQFNRDDVLDRAMQLFWQQGYESTGIAQLGEHLGIGRQSLYATFGDKRGLFIEAIRRYADEMMRPLIELLQAPGSGLANINAVLDQWLANAISEDFCGCLMTNSISEFGSSDPEIASILKTANERLVKAYRSALERAITDGELPETTNARATARLLANTGHGLSVAAKVTDAAYAKDVVASVRSLLQPPR